MAQAYLVAGWHYGNKKPQVNAVVVLNIGQRRACRFKFRIGMGRWCYFSKEGTRSPHGVHITVMKIRDVRTHLLTACWSNDPYMSVALHSTALIEVLTDGGISGVGETILGYFAPEAVGPLVNFYKPLLIGADPESISSLWQRLYVSSIWWGRSGAACSVLSGIDLALWDIKAKAAGVPLYKLLGGLAKSRVPLYCSGGPSLWPNSENVAKCRYYVERGYRAVKFATGFFMKEGFSEDRRNGVKPIPSAMLAQQEAEKCQLVRNAVGGEVEIILDGHQGGIADPYSLSHALRVAEAVAPYGLLFFEEPLPYTDRRGYAELRRQGKVAIAGGESLSGTYEFHQYFEIGALDIAQPDLTFVGGLTPCQEIAVEAVTRNLRIAMHCGGTAGPGLAASVHLSFATAAAVVLEHLLHNTSIQNDLLLEPVCLKEGSIAPPTAPGSGVVDLTESLLGKYPYIPGTGEVT